MIQKCTLFVTIKWKPIIHNDKGLVSPVKKNVPRVCPIAQEVTNELYSFSEVFPMFILLLQAS